MNKILFSMLEKSIDLLADAIELYASEEEKKQLEPLLNQFLNTLDNLKK